MGMDSTRLRLVLEEHYPGLSAEYAKGTGGGEECEDAADERTRESARVRLRGAEEVPMLFGYQRELVEQVERTCAARPPENIGLLTLPTGAGKTRTVAVALLRMLTKGNARLVLWLAPTRELLGQAAGTLRAVWQLDRKAVDLELVRTDLLAGFPEDVECGVLFATPQLIAARLKRGRIPDADIVVFDEAHHVEAPVFRRALEHVRGMRRRSAAIVGLSATPGRATEGETERLVDFFGGRLLRSEQLGRDPIGNLQRRGVLARVAFKDVPLENWGRLQARGWSRDVGRFRAIVRLAHELAQKARVLVFAASVDAARLLAAALRCQGTRAEAVSSVDRDEVRLSRLRAFERGDLSVILNKRLLATGYDCPTVQHVILATRIGSAILFEQIVGRATRGPLVGGHARSTVWEFDDHLAAHGLPQSYYRYSDYDWEGI